MTCALDPTGPCTLVPDGNGCGPIKAYNADLPLVSITDVLGHFDGITVGWALSEPFPEITVRLVCRDSDGYEYYPSTPVPWSDGEITLTGVPTDSVLTFFIMAESSVHYGPAAQGSGLADGS